MVVIGESFVVSFVGFFYLGYVLRGSGCNCFFILSLVGRFLWNVRDRILVKRFVRIELLLF